MSTTLPPKNKDLCDKENPPHPLPTLKKLNTAEEAPLKKVILGDSTTQAVKVDDDPEADSIGARLVLKKRESQKENQKGKETGKGEFCLKLIKC